MQITPETKKLSELMPIADSVRYQIPVYQRDYSWKNEQVSQLFDDISNEANGYYLGNLLITVSSSDDIEHVGNNLDIVDGQQRMITLSLFLLAIWERLNDLVEEGNLTQEMVENIGGYKRDIKRQLLFDESPRIMLQEKDKPAYASLLRIISNDEPGFGNRQLVKRYKFVKSLIDSTSFPSFKEIIDFYNKINATEMLRITVPDLSDAFSVFSSLNSKGLPLTLIDLLKNDYLRVAHDSGIDDTEALDKWISFISIFSIDENEPNMGIVTQFLLNNYDTFEGDNNSSMTKGRALTAYRRIFNNENEYIDKLIERAKVFREIICLTDNSKLNPDITQRLHKLSMLESSQVYPLLLLLLCQNRLNISDSIPGILDMLIKFYVRRNIVLKPKASNIRAQIINLIRKIQQGLTGEEAADLIKNTLQSLSPTDKELNIALDDSIYDKNSSTTRFVLIDLERKHGHYFTKANPDTLDSYIDNQNGRRPVLRWTIEHILPEGENLPDSWKEMISPNDPDNVSNKQEEYMHLFGNLTLTPYNPELGQRSFVDKRDFRDQDDWTGLRLGLFLNSSIADANSGEALENKKAWTSDDITRRNEWFKKLILEDYKIN